MASRERIDAYRTRRPDSVLSDDMIAWELDNAPDCAADIPPEFKAELERIAEEDEDRPAPRLSESARAPLSLYDFDSSPHGGRWKPLPDHGGEPTISPRTHVHHSIVGSGAGAWGFFANSTSVESTNIVLKSGYLWQIMSRREQADANYHANAFAISTETEDNGNPNTDPWTAAQIDTLVWVTLQDIADFGIPRRICPAWDEGGIGYHSMWGAPSQWTPAVGKTCPGTVRIRQWNDIVVPRILGTLQQEEDEMTGDDWARLEKLLDTYMRRGVRYVDHGDETVAGASNNLENVREDIRRLATATGVRLDALENLLTPEQPT
jgi:hypothetical protein